MSAQADVYLLGILNREAVDTSPLSPVRAVKVMLQPLLTQWGGPFMLNVSPSGSFAKGTANNSGTDIDLFVSVSEQTPDTLKQIYEKLFTKLSQNGYTPKRQDVSINVRVGGYDVDLVPGKRQNNLTMDHHSLYRRRADTWTKTNIATHIGYIEGAGRLNEIRLIKLWRNQNGLDFPSSYLN